MKNLITQNIYEHYLSDIKQVDISELKSKKVFSIIENLQEYFDNNIDLIKFDTNKILIHKDSANNLFNKYNLELEKGYFVIYTDNIPLNQNYNIENILVKHNECYEYGAFDEYNLDADTIKSISEDINIRNCLSSKNDCNYIESYSYRIYLELSLKEHV